MTKCWYWVVGTQKPYCRRLCRCRPCGCVNYPARLKIDDECECATGQLSIHVGYSISSVVPKLTRPKHARPCERTLDPLETGTCHDGYNQASCKAERNRRTVLDAADDSHGGTLAHRAHSPCGWQPGSHTSQIHVGTIPANKVCSIRDCSARQTGSRRSDCTSWTTMTPWLRQKPEH